MPLWQGYHFLYHFPPIVALSRSLLTCDQMLSDRCCRMLPDVTGCDWIWPDVAGCDRMLQNVARMWSNVWEYMWIFKNVWNCNKMCYDFHDVPSVHRPKSRLWGRVVTWSAYCLSPYAKSFTMVIRKIFRPGDLHKVFTDDRQVQVSSTVCLLPLGMTSYLQTFTNSCS